MRKVASRARRRPAAAGARRAAVAAVVAARAARAGGGAETRSPAPLSVVILAAGEGKRMKSRLPKVLQPLAGRPLLKHVIDTARELEPASIHVVYGHGGDAVRAALGAEPVVWTLQQPRLGTGHALSQALPHIPETHVVLVLYGDVPLISRATLARLLAARGTGVALLTMQLDDPQGYGRIVRERGAVRRIVEEADASVAHRAIRECNTGILAAPAAYLRRWLKALSNDNAQREYYLTDVIARAVVERVPVTPLPAASASETLGVNDKAQLAQLEAAWREQLARRLMLGGVTVADPARLDVRGEVTHGADVFLDVNVVLEGHVSLGDGVRVGPGCVIRDSELGAGTQVFAYCVIDHAVIGPNCNIGPYRAFPAALDPRRRRAHRQLRGGEELRARRGFQGQPPGLRRGRAPRRARQHRRRHDHCQLRRRQQEPHRDRGRRAHRQQQRAGGAHHGGRGRHHRRRFHRDPGGTGRKAHPGARAPGDHRGLAAADQTPQVTLRGAAWWFGRAVIHSPGVVTYSAGPG